ncbi:MAG: phosphotransferase [Acidimicrobiales bacterium]
MAVRSAEALRATAAVCRAVDLPVSHLDVIRRSTYVAVRIGASPYLARVGRAAETYENHAREIAIARALAAAGAPVAEPAPLPEPLLVDGDSAVGLWLWVDEVAGGQPTMADLGSALRTVHDTGGRCDLAALGLPEFTAPTRARDRLRRLGDRGGLDGATIDELAALVDVLRPPAHANGVHGLVHGDFRAANVLATVAGPVVIDFDAASFGPLAWDLTLVAQQHRHFGLSSTEFETFVTAYGGVADWDGLDSLCRLRDLTSTVWALSTAATIAPDFAAEARRRLASVRDPDDRTRWTWDGLPSARR